MKDNENLFKSTLTSLLNERLSEAEASSLKDEGFRLRRPTRKAAVMIALYKKAVSGDLSAMKEMRTILGDPKDFSADSGKAVVIVDDIGKTAL